jgi:putative heme iron utilization protein
MSLKARRAMQSDVPFDARLAVKNLLRQGRSGALATLMAGSGDPYCSLVNVATDSAGAPLLLLSKLALHTKNILADSRMSLMLDERKEGDPLTGTRIMLMGRAAVVDAKAVRAAYLRRHPEAEMFAGFADFSFYRMDMTVVHLVAGFGRIVDLPARDVLTDTSDAQGLAEAEAEAIEHLNTGHEDTCRLYATRLLGAASGDWRCVGIDPEGMELQHGSVALRLVFPQRVTGPGPLRAVLKDLAAQARAV